MSWFLSCGVVRAGPKPFQSLASQNLGKYMPQAPTPRASPLIKHPSTEPPSAITIASLSEERPLLRYNLLFLVRLQPTRLEGLRFFTDSRRARRTKCERTNTRHSAHVTGALPQSFSVLLLSSLLRAPLPESARSPALSSCDLPTSLEPMPIGRVKRVTPRTPHVNGRISTPLEDVAMPVHAPAVP